MTIVFILLIGIPSVLIYTLKEDSNGDISNKIEANQSIVTNILLIGTDGRENEENYRSDSMIIATIDLEHKDIKLTSLARDTYVNVPNNGKRKLNEAYYFGKEELLLETIKENFKIDIDKYITIDFDDLMNIIFVLGGVQVDVQEYEIDGTNAIIPSSYETCTYEDKGDMKLITDSGMQTLNGYQAIAYSRMRYADNAINRDRRQRAVLMSVLRNMKQVATSNYEGILEELYPYYKTNLTSSEILNLAANAYTNGAINNVKQAQFPIIDDVHVKGGVYKDAGWVWLYDLNSIGVLKDFIYNDIDMKENEYMLDDSKVQLNY